MGVGADVPMVSTEGIEVSEVDEERAGIVERTRSCFRCASAHAINASCSRQFFFELI